MHGICECAVGIAVRGNQPPLMSGDRLNGYALRDDTLVSACEGDVTGLGRYPHS